MANEILIALVTIFVSLFIGAAVISIFNLPEAAIAVFVLLGAAIAYFVTKKKKSDGVSL